MTNSTSNCSSLMKLKSTNKITFTRTEDQSTRTPRKKMTRWQCLTTKTKSFPPTSISNKKISPLKFRTKIIKAMSTISTTRNRSQSITSSSTCRAWAVRIHKSNNNSKTITQASRSTRAGAASMRTWCSPQEIWLRTRPSIPNTFSRWGTTAKPRDLIWMSCPGVTTIIKWWCDILTCTRLLKICWGTH